MRNSARSRSPIPHNPQHEIIEQRVRFSRRMIASRLVSILKSRDMSKLDDRTLANIEVALNDAFRSYPNGGDHERRKHVAQKLMQSAECGNTTLGGLSVVAKSALNEVRN